MDAKERLEVVAKDRRRLSVVLKIFVLLKFVKMVSVERVKRSIKKTSGLVLPGAKGGGTCFH